MIRLHAALTAWGSAAFGAILKNEIEQLAPGQLPLQQGLSVSSAVGSSPHTVRIIRFDESPECIRVRAGIFYSGVIAGCSCADDPTPVDEQNEYCEVQLEIDKRTAETRVTLIPDA